MRLVKLQPDVRRCYWVFRSPAFEREKKRKALVSQTISWAVWKIRNTLTLERLFNVVVVVVVVVVLAAVGDTSVGNGWTKLKKQQQRPSEKETVHSVWIGLFLFDRVGSLRVRASSPLDVGPGAVSRKLETAFEYESNAARVRRGTRRTIWNGGGACFRMGSSHRFRRPTTTFELGRLSGCVRPLCVCVCVCVFPRWFFPRFERFHVQPATDEWGTLSFKNRKHSTRPAKGWRCQLVAQLGITLSKLIRLSVSADRYVPR